MASFSYLVRPEDHTTGLSATFTPRAEVAQNDAAVVVVEDDSQDGIDHVDRHRNVLLVVSPYAKQTSGASKHADTGYIGHERHDQASVIRTMELILGLPALSSSDQNARPLYDLFQDMGAAELTPAGVAPFSPAADPRFINETGSLPATPALQALKTKFDSC
jgi:hypothetical protein